MAKNIYVNEIEEEPEECVIHTGLKVKAVCNSCEEPVCFQCLLGAHNGHPISSLEEARENVRDALLNQRRTLKQHIKMMENSIKSLNDKEAENDREYTVAMDDIQKAGNEMKVKLENAILELQTEVKIRHAENLKELTRAKTPLQDHLQMANSKLEKADVVINSDNMYNTIHLEQEIRRFTEGHYADVPSVHIHLPKFCSQLITKESLKTQLGELTFSGNRTEGDGEDAYEYIEPTKNLPAVMPKPSLKSSSEVEVPVMKSRHKKDDIYREYAVSNSSLGFTIVRKTLLSETMIKSICPLTMNQAWTINDTGKSLRLVGERGHTIRTVTANTRRGDIALTSEGAVLLTCPDKCCIKKYSQDGTIRIFINTPDFFPHGICIHFISEDIFVGLVDSNTYDVKSDSIRFIQRYSRKGEPLQQINIQRSASIFGKKTSLLTIPHKIKINQSTGDIGLVNWTKDHQGQVIVFTSDGRKKFMYPNDQKTQFEPMDMIFTTTRRIVICDAISRRLHMIDQDGSFIKVLHTFDKIPSAMAYFGEGVLWVGNCDGELIVINFKE